MRYIAIAVYSYGSGWWKLAEFDKPDLPMRVLSSELRDGFTNRIIVVASNATWPENGSWHDLPVEPLLETVG